MVDSLVLLFALVTFCSSIISATFGLGGGFLILAVLGIVLPVAAMVPLHSVLALGLLTSRFWYFREYVSWDIVRSFVPGAVIGVVIGARIYVALPEAVIASTVSMLMLVTVWFPHIQWRPSFRHPFFYVGIVHAFLSTLFSFGALMQPLMVRTRLNRMQIIGTLAAALFVMTLIKTLSYAAFGFDYQPYAWIIIAGVLASFPGAAVGKRLARRFREEQFRLAFRVLMTLLALRLLYRAWTLI